MTSVIDVSDHYILVEYEVDGFVDRREVPRVILPEINRKGPVTLSINLLKVYGIPYSNVDLIETLGTKFDNLPIAKLQDALRRAGLWLREDYKLNPKLVDHNVRQFRGNVKELDATTVLNAALRGGNDV